MSTFSPLFIGEGSSTKIRPCRSQAGLFFQSPLHRGRVFNSLDKALNEPLGAPFSPLFIGEGSSTHLDFRPRTPLPETFSPLFIGEGSSTATAARLTSAAASAFSPLFIGEGSSTISSHSRGSCRRRLSVPSSSGKGLQLDGEGMEGVRG